MSALPVSQEERIRSALAHVPPVDRDQWVRMGMAVKSELGEAGFDIWNEWSQNDESYNERNARDVWRSIKPGGKVGIGTLFHEAGRLGWRDDSRPDPELLAEQKRRSAERLREYEAEQRQRQEQAAEQARALWAASSPVSGHAYLERKGIEAHGLRQDAEGCLVIPLRDASGTLWSLQTIGANCTKRFLPGGRKSGCYFAIGKAAGVLCICEGFATGASIHEATGHGVAVAFDCGNLLPVAQALRGKYPGMQHAPCDLRRR